MMISEPTGVNDGASTPQRLRELLSPQGLAEAGSALNLPGCWDAFSALLVQRAGFPAAFLSGSALSMTRLGQPDVGILDAAELTATTRLICDAISIPLIADGDAGFSEQLSMDAFISGMEAAGAAAVQIEDQVDPKRCGHAAGKEIVPLAQGAQRIADAVAARKDMLIVARTDALALEGVDAAIERAEAYLQAGADLIFVEGPETNEEVAKIAAAFTGKIPLVHNLVGGGRTPHHNAGLFHAEGFSVLLHPLLLLHGLAENATTLLDYAGSRGEPSALAGLDSIALANAIVAERRAENSPS